MSEQAEQKGKRGWWGSTLSKLRSALSRTRETVVGSVGSQEHQAATVEPPSSVSGDEEFARQNDTVSPIEAEGEGTVSFVMPVDSTSPAESGSPATGHPGARGSRQARADIRVGSAQPATTPREQPVPASAQSAPPCLIDEEFLEDLEERLIKADLGVRTVAMLVDDLRRKSRKGGWTTRDVEDFLHREFLSIFKSTPSGGLEIVPGKTSIILVIGVNGTGKTTSIGKLSWRLKQDGHKVLIAAGDTFRAAAESQLEIWAERAGVDIVRLSDGADPGAVVFKALEKARLESYDVVVIDTAGRLHNKANLMAELKKVRNVIEKHGAGMSFETLLVLDASTGQNGLQQARVFTEVCPLTGVILTKLDGTAKGGIVFSIARELKIPVKLIGLGEKIDDLRDFEPELFVEALF